MKTNKKPWYKRWTTWLGAFILLIIIGAFLPDPPSDVAKQEAVAQVEKDISESKVRQSEDKAAKEAKAKADAEAKESAKAQAEKEKSDKAAEKLAKQAELDAILPEKFATLVELSDGIIVDIKKSPYSDDWSHARVVVSDAWYESAEHEKERFAESTASIVKATLIENGADDVIFVDFVDTYDKMLAEEKTFGGYEIKR